jgi:hypothetical protein
LVLVRHVVSFHGNIMTTAQSRRRSEKTKAGIRIAATIGRSVRPIPIAPVSCQRALNQRTWRARIKRIIMDGAMNHETGADKTKLVTMIAGIQKKACCASVGVIKTVIKPTPKTTAFTIR